jgi:cytochrome oxidase Cu insertion factor (SCO1/SenC/PrrC family)
MISDRRSQSSGESKPIQFYSRSHEAVIRVYDEPGNVIETHEHSGDSK